MGRGKELGREGGRGRESRERIIMSHRMYLQRQTDLQVELKVAAGKQPRASCTCMHKSLPGQPVFSFGVPA